jgi:ElaB/YqjD/DUF883 family membrane-anchored ribosome-binding protein
MKPVCARCAGFLITATWSKFTHCPDNLPMNMAKFLKTVANTLVAAQIAKLVARDMAAEVRTDAAALRSRAQGAVENRPYRAAGAAATIGLALGLFLHMLGHLAASPRHKKT